MRLIDADALYERTAEWEAQASAHIEWLIREPIEEMTEHDKSEWKRWTAIMGERTAFKHDVADAPTIEVEPEIIRCKDCKYASPNRVYGCRLEPFSASDEGSRLYSDDFCSRAERKDNE